MLIKNQIFFEKNSLLIAIEKFTVVASLSFSLFALGEFFPDPHMGLKPGSLEQITAVNGLVTYTLPVLGVTFLCLICLMSSSL
jgi:hypothetical protein